MRVTWLPVPVSLGARARHGTLGAAVVGVVLLVLAAVSGVSAQGVRLTGLVTDPEHVLGSCRQEVLDAGRGLFVDTGTSVFTLLLPGDGAALDAVTDGTWEDNPSITDKDVLFVGSTGEPHARLQQGVTLDERVSQSEMDAITESLRGHALAGDWCSGTLAVISGYKAELVESGFSSQGWPSGQELVDRLIAEYGYPFEASPIAATATVFADPSAPDYAEAVSLGALLPLDVPAHVVIVLLGRQADPDQQSWRHVERVREALAPRSDADRLAQLLRDAVSRTRAREDAHSHVERAAIPIDGGEFVATYATGGTVPVGSPPGSPPAETYAILEFVPGGASPVVPPQPIPTPFRLPTPGPLPTPTPTLDAAARVVEVTLFDSMTIEPDRITVRAGEPVRFVITNAGALPHDFFIGSDREQRQRENGEGEPGPDRYVAVPPGETVTLLYTFPLRGRTVAGCVVPGHYSAGQRAYITIE